MEEKLIDLIENHSCITILKTTERIKRAKKRGFRLYEKYVGVFKLFSKDLNELQEIQKSLARGKIYKDGNDYYSLRFGANDGRYILGFIINKLEKKRAPAQVLLDFLNYRQEFSKSNQKVLYKSKLEEYYSELHLG